MKDAQTLSSQWPTYHAHLRFLVAQRFYSRTMQMLTENRSALCGRGATFFGQLLPTHFNGNSDLHTPARSTPSSKVSKIRHHEQNHKYIMPRCWICLFRGLEELELFVHQNQQMLRFESPLLWAIFARKIHRLFWGNFKCQRNKIKTFPPA